MGEAAGLWPRVWVVARAILARPSTIKAGGEGQGQPCRGPHRRGSSPAPSPVTCSSVRAACGWVDCALSGVWVGEQSEGRAPREGVEEVADMSGVLAGVGRCGNRAPTPGQPLPEARA